MSRFKFRNRIIKLKIAGNVFKIDANAGEDLVKKKDILINVGKAYKAGEKTSAEVIEVYAEHINNVLGQKAFNKIFAKREPDLLDCIGVITFIASEIAKFNRKAILAK